MANEKPTSKPPSIGFHSSERSDRSKDMPPGPNRVRIAGIWTDATAPTREPTTTPEERARMAELKHREISLDHTILRIAQNFSMVEKALSDHADRTIRLKDKNRVDEAARLVYGYLEFVATEYGGLKPGDPPKHFVGKAMNMIPFPKAEVVFPSIVEWLKKVGENSLSLFEIGELKRSRESDIRGNSNPETLWLLLQTIANILYRDEWQSAKEAWDKRPSQFYKYPGNSRKKSTGHSQAYCYDAFAFLRRLKDKGTIKQEEYDGAHKEMQKMLEKHEEDPCSGEIETI